MAQSVRIDRDAFKRGVNDVMTFAPLREAMRSATGFFGGVREHGSDKRNDAQNETGKNIKTHDGRSSSSK